MSLNGVSMPIYGQFTTFVTNGMDLVVPATPNLRHELIWLANYVGENGNQANLTLTYGSVSANLQMAFAASGINHNLNRF